MSVFRINKNSDYTTMCNYHLKDKNLSLKAKGLLSVMLSLSDEWDYSVLGLCSISKENETAINSALKELKEYGYLVVTRERNIEGKFEYKYDIFEKPYLEKPPLENPYPENMGTDNNIYNINNIELNTKDKILNNKKEEKEKENDPSVLRIFAWWNVKNIIKHSKLNETRIKAIKNKLKEYSVDEIEKVITHYEIVLHDNSYYWSYTWSLEDFFNRKNGFTTFLDDGSNWVNYQKQKNGNMNNNLSKETKYPQFDDVGYIR